MADRKLNARKTALIIQDLQNDVITEGGAFASSGAPAHAKKQNVVEHVKKLAGAMRKAGAIVIHIHYIVEPGAPGLKLNAPLFRGLAESKAVVRGTWGAAPVDGLEPQQGDVVVEKMRMNGFHGTKLETILQGYGIEAFVITGAWTNFSIEHTARHGADSGYEVVVATDGTSTINDEWQNAGINFALQNIADRLSCDEIIKALS
ncbi:MAG TPA: cysteine hydrolase [Candidatus Acidoferrales bacterium]|jgi:gluconolactonase|nr:cysteine hydrolase [Candidatus Acidoferrales bacterium]